MVPNSPTLSQRWENQRPQNLLIIVRMVCSWLRCKQQTECISDIGWDITTWENWKERHGVVILCNFSFFSSPPLRPACPQAPPWWTACPRTLWWCPACPLTLPWCPGILDSALASTLIVVTSNCGSNAEWWGMVKILDNSSRAMSEWVRKGLVRSVVRQDVDDGLVWKIGSLKCGWVESDCLVTNMAHCKVVLGWGSSPLRDQFTSCAVTWVPVPGQSESLPK